MSSDDDGADVDEELDELRELYVELTEKLVEFQTRLEELERKTGAETGSQEEASSTEEEPTPEESSQPDKTEDLKPVEPDESELNEPDDIEEDSSDEATDSGRVSLDEGLELNVGLKWMGRIGATAVAFGVAFFFMYAVQEGLIGYTARVVLGFLAGAGLFAIGNAFVDRPDYRLWSMITAGTGVAVSYFSIYASWGFEAYREATGMTPGVNVALLTLVVVAALAVSIHREIWVLGAEAFVLGYVTAFMVPEPGVVPLTYVLVLSIASVVFAIYMSWQWGRLGLVGIVGSYGVYSWWVEVTHGESAVLGYGFLFAYAGVFTAYAFVCDERHGDVQSDIATALNFLNAGIFYWMFYLVTRYQFPDLLGLGTLALGLAYLTLTYVAWRRTSEPIFLSSALAAWLLILLSAWIELEAGQITVAWASIATVLIAASYVEDRKGFYIAAYATIAVTAAKSLLVDSFVTTGETAFLAGTTPAFAAAAAVCFLGYFVLSLRDSQKVEGLSEPDFLFWTGTAIVAVYLAIELETGQITVAWAALAASLTALTYLERRKVYYLAAYAVAAVTAAKSLFVDPFAVAGRTGFFTGTTAEASAWLGGTTSAFVAAAAVCVLEYFVLSRKRPEEVGDIWDPDYLSWAGSAIVAVYLAIEFDGFGLSVSWTLFALALLVLGLGVKKRVFRLQSLVLFALTVVKVFVVDTAGLDILGRTISFLVLGVILLLTSFIYSRYRQEIQEWI